MTILDNHLESEFVQRLLKPNRVDFASRFKDLWSSFSGLEDGKFWQELDKDPCSQLWEMMTAHLLRNERYELKSKDKGPDFLVFRKGKPIMYVEAIAPGEGESGNPNSVPEIDMSQAEMKLVPTDQILLRIRSAIEEKFKKQKEYLQKKSIEPDIPYVIAIGGIKLGPRVRINPPASLQSLLGVGNHYFTVNPRNREEIDVGNSYRSNVCKYNGNKVEMIPFMKNEYSSISGVLFSSSSFFSLDMNLLKESHFVHNPLAMNPLQDNSFINICSFSTKVSDDGEINIYQTNKI